MKAVIIEDSRLAREGLKKLLKKFSSIDILGEAEDADQGVELIGNHKPDVIFLDIDMPGKNGFAMLSELSYDPQVIFTTAYSEYAVRSFDFNTIDYLLKPINPERLAKAIQKLNDMQELNQQDDNRLNANSKIFIKDSNENYFVTLSKIRRFESCGNYTRVYFDDIAPFVYKSLSKVEERLPEDMFFRVNRQQIINLRYVKTMEDGVAGNYVIRMDDGEEVAASRNQSSRLRALFSL